MPTIVCTPGGATDNSYITLANAGVYFANTLREATWLGYAQADRERALIQATAEIEALGGPAQPYSPARPLFSGVPYDRTTPQALHFPRSSDLNLSAVKTVPANVTAAVCEQAWWLLERNANGPLLDRRRLQAEGVQQVSVDGLSEAYGVTEVPLGIAPEAWGRIRSFVARGRGYPTVVR